ncbi:MAG: hypothetical protein NTZ09_00390 [Candidatus Hydrogenedentes bacterium]|nr:hypothetical protein [Candidatus Hydrogenedentota bacterium]
MTKSTKPQGACYRDARKTAFLSKILREILFDLMKDIRLVLDGRGGEKTNLPQLFEKNS